MVKKELRLNSWYRELPDLFKEEMKGKAIKIILFGDDKEITVKVDSFFNDLVVSNDYNNPKDNIFICGIVSRDGRRYNFIQMKSIETEKYQFNK